MKAVKVMLVPLPKGWDDRPKECWAPHPGTREICGLPPDGHRIHKRKHPNGVELECWREPRSTK